MKYLEMITMEKSRGGLHRRRVQPLGYGCSNAIRVPFHTRNMDLEIIARGELAEQRQQEICAFLDSQDTSHPFQFPQWISSASGSESWCWLWKKGTALTAVASCGVQRPAGARVPLKALVINRGPVCDDVGRWHEAANDLAGIAEDRRFIYIDAAPERIAGNDAEHALFPPRWKPIGAERMSLRLDLTRREEEIFGGFRKVARYEVRRAEKAGVSVSKAGSQEESERFLDLYLRAAKRKGFIPDAPEFVRAILAWLQGEPNRGGLFLASRENLAVGGAIVVRAARRCWYVWGASGEHSDFSAGHLLQWHAIRWAKSQGCTEYDFGGYTPEAKSGPAWFKEGFGGKVVRLTAPHRIVLREAQYRLIQVAAKAKGIFATR